MAFIAGLGAAAVPITESVAWALIGRATRLPEEQLRSDYVSGMVLDSARAWGVAISDASQISGAALFAGWIIALIAATPSMVGLWSVRRTFLESAEGRPFSEVSVRSFRWFAWASLVGVVAMILERTATGLAVSTLSPEIQDQLSVSLGSPDFSRLFGALLLVAVAQMFAAGKRLAEDVEGLL